MMLKDLLGISKCLYKIGWIEIVEEVTMADMFYAHALKMMSVSTSIGTKPAVCMRPSPTNALLFHGGMKIWLQIDLGTRPFNCAQGYVNRVQK